MPWAPWLGAVPEPRSRTTSFRVWAPRTRALSVHIVGGGARETLADLRPDGHGYYAATLEGVGAGARYLYRFPDGTERPDPASLLQPEGVHGPSEVVHLPSIAPRRRGPDLPLERLVTCELHLGTYTPEGTAESAGRHLGELTEAGYTALEVMPVAAFAGDRNWGYDGAHPFAALVGYGGPAGLARLVDVAHERGLAALLDVVYNHLGPEGNYLAEFGPYFTQRHKTPWGDAVNFDGQDSGPVRGYFVENALRWVSAQGGGFDGLRLDAVQGIVDDSPRHILLELAEAVHGEARESGRALYVIAESDLNDPRLIEQYGMDSAWSDDFHHALHVALTGERSGYYRDYTPPEAEPTQALAAALREGFVYTGQRSAHRGRAYGRPGRHLPGRRFVVCAQNHDQVGNRAAGERLVALTSPGGLRAAAALVALQPCLPLFFQGEEWSAPEPFLYFTSHGDPALAEAVRKGRREEFASFEAFGGHVPDPQALATFEQSVLDRAHRDSAQGRASLRWHRALLDLRRDHPALRDDSLRAVEARALSANGVRGVSLVRRAGGRTLALVCALDEGPCLYADALPEDGFRVLLDSSAPEQSPAPDARPARIEGRAISLCGRQAVVLEK
jgi:maltooligosyltrehalose trehalohydrolase